MQQKVQSNKTIPMVSLQHWQKIRDDGQAIAQPVVIQDAFLDQAQSWTPQSLTQRWPNKQVRITVNLPQHGVPYLQRARIHEDTASLSDFIKLLDNNFICYLNQIPIADFPGLQQELSLSRLHLDRLFSVNLWLGGRTKSGLHFDNADNLFGQIYGRKRVLLIAPQHSKYLYQFADNPSKSAVDPESPDLKRHPLFTHCEIWNCVLEPGHALFIPRGWWHFIAAEDISISVNCWHGTTLSDRERISLYLAGGPRVLLRTVRDFMWHGLLGRPYQQRLFSPPPPGLQAYEYVRSMLRKRAIDQ